MGILFTCISVIYCCNSGMRTNQPPLHEMDPTFANVNEANNLKLYGLGVHFFALVVSFLSFLFCFHNERKKMKLGG